MATRQGVPVQVNQIAGRLVARLRGLLKERLLAVYLFGSATPGAFEPQISDIDAVAVLEGDPTNSDVSTLGAMHDELAKDAPAWNDRIEFDYLSARALAEFGPRLALARENLFTALRSTGDGFSTGTRCKPAE